VHKLAAFVEKRCRIHPRHKIAGRAQTG
jgi:hypothetical protein